jgi:uncharacterized DUF497 family protein
MKYYDWSESKNKRLKEQRGVSFEDVIKALENDKILAKIEGAKKYPHQMQYLVNINDYPYAVPYVEDDEKIFLKTIIPSRKYKHLIE